MKNVFFKLMTMSLLSVLLFSCKEEEIVPTNEELLMAKTWRVEVLTVKTSGISIDLVEVLSQQLGAEPVIEIDFVSDSVYKITDKNGLLEFAGVGTDADGKWELEGADKRILVLDKGTEVETKLNIKTLSATDFVSTTTVKLDSSIVNSIPTGTGGINIDLDGSDVDVELDFRPL